MPKKKITLDYIKTMIGINGDTAKCLKTLALPYVTPEYFRRWLDSKPIDVPVCENYRETPVELFISEKLGSDIYISGLYICQVGRGPIYKAPKWSRHLKKRYENLTYLALPKECLEIYRGRKN